VNARNAVNNGASVALNLLFQAEVLIRAVQ